MAGRESSARRRRGHLVLAAAAAVVAMVVVAVVVVAVREDEDTVGADALELRIGLVTSFTGDLSVFGPPIDQSVRLALDLFNESAQRTDAGLSAVLAGVEDDRTEAASGLEAARKLVTVDDIDVLIGSTPSAVTGPIAQQITIPKGILQITPASTAPELSDLADRGLLWRTAPSDVLQVEVLVNAVAAEFGSEATVNVGGRDDAYGVAMADAFVTAWNARGGDAPTPVHWKPDQHSYTDAATQLVEGHPDAWVVIDFPRTFAAVAEALVGAGWDPSRTFATDGLRSTRLVAEAGVEATESMRGTAPTWPAAAAADAYEQLFAERSSAGIEPEAYSAHAFDAVLLACLAALRAGSTDPALVKDHLADVSAAPGERYTFEQLDDAIEAVLNGDDIDYEGASGGVDLDERGDVHSAHYEVWQIRDGVLETMGTEEVGR